MTFPYKNYSLESMSPVLIVFTILSGAAVLALIFYIINMLVFPQKIETVENLIRNGKKHQAIRLAKRIIAKKPRDMEAHYILGKTYLDDNQYELALMEFKTVNAAGSFTRKIPEQEFRQGMAKLYLHFNQEEEALKEFLILIKLNPKNADYHFSAGELFENRNSKKAIECYNKAIELNPQCAVAHARLCAIFYMMRQNKAAESSIAAALKIDPQNAEAHFYRGRILMERGKYDKAIEALENAVRSPELKQKALIERGRCYIAANSYERAAVEFTAAIKASKSPSSHDTLYARYFLSLCYEKTRKIEDAIIQWEEIQKHAKGFMDIDEKLSIYSSTRTTDKIKEYLIAGREDFFTICKTVASDFLRLIPLENNIKETKYGCVLVATESDEGMRNVRKMPHLIVFYREPTLISENFLRNLHGIMKKQSIVKSTVLTSSGFTINAIQFAENRPINLIGPEKLDIILNKVNPFGKK